MCVWSLWAFPFACIGFSRRQLPLSRTVGSQRVCCVLKKKKTVSERGASTYVRCVIGLVAPTHPVMGAATVPGIRATVLHQTSVALVAHMLMEIDVYILTVTGFLCKYIRSTVIW